MSSSSEASDAGVLKKATATGKVVLTVKGAPYELTGDLKFDQKSFSAVQPRPGGKPLKLVFKWTNANVFAPGTTSLSVGQAHVTTVGVVGLAENVPVHSGTLQISEFVDSRRLKGVLQLNPGSSSDALEADFDLTVV
ncbi:hypothetical protein ACIQSO_12625 [Pseudomonas putida]|uniref:hypothetical protein n=1 Tax=Pseudomonas putida TaxID=303 RepID=UPI00383A744E